MTTLKARFEEKFGDDKPGEGYKIRRIANVGGHYGQFPVGKELLTFIKRELMLLAEEIELQVAPAESEFEEGDNAGLNAAATIIRTRADEI